MNQALVSSLGEHTASILLHAENLLADYQAHDLHQFRVHIRHIRSLLKRIKSGPAEYFLRSWRDMFTVTNPARDLDVFLDAAGQLLPAEQFDLFAASLRPRVQGSHDAVTELLKSGNWRRHLAGWRGLLKNLENRPSDRSHGHVSGVVRKARKACRKAMARGTDRDWHKFRIAVKNLRYVADASRTAPGTDEEHLGRIIEDCKVLQTLLGDWHDTIVQLEMIRNGDLAAELDGTPELAPVAARLESLIGIRKRDLLEQIGQVLEKGNAFIAA